MIFNYFLYIHRVEIDYHKVDSFMYIYSTLLIAQYLFVKYQIIISIIDVLGILF